MVHNSKSKWSSSFKLALKAVTDSAARADAKSIRYHELDKENQCFPTVSADVRNNYVGNAQYGYTSRIDSVY